MKTIRKFIKKNVVDPFVDQYYPRGMRFYKNEKTREDRELHYRYPSPASEAPERDSLLADHRVGYSDSPHNIRYDSNSLAPEIPTQTLLFHNLHVTMEDKKTGWLISCK